MVDSDFVVEDSAAGLLSDAVAGFVSDLTADLSSDLLSDLVSDLPSAALSVLGLVDVLKSVAYQPLPLSLKPAAVHLGQTGFAALGAIRKLCVTHFLQIFLLEPAKRATILVNRHISLQFQNGGL